MLYRKHIHNQQDQRPSWTCSSLANLSSVVTTLLILLATITSAQTRVLDSSSHHLRNGNEPEWDEFANSHPKKELVISFDVSSKNEHTLSITQYDVKQNWNILLNDQKIGSLVVDGNQMRTYFKLAPELLISGKNKLAIQPASTVIDDIVISEITIDERPFEEVLGESTVHVDVIEGKTNKLIPARITIVDKKGILQSTATKMEEHVAVRPGFVYTGSGKASLLLPHGEYIIYAGRGFEYSVDSVVIRLTAGEKLIRRLVLEREVPTDGLLSSDTHIHTLTHSGHGDATDKERALTIAGEGIELPVITEHNKIADFSKTVSKLRLDSTFTFITGDEVTTAIGHFNVFPFRIHDVVPDHKVKSWNELSKNFSVADSQVIILNHGRDIHNGFRPFDPKRQVSIAGLSLDDWEIPANAMEIVNSGALLDDPMRLFHDWFGLLNRGYRVTPVGASDSHDVSRYLIGQARTYIKTVSDNSGEADISEALRNLRQGKVMVSFGLLPKVTVNKKYGPGENVLLSKNTVIDIEVAGPGWVKAERVSLYANGIKIREEHIKNGSTAGTKWKAQWKLPRQKNDVYLVVVTEGRGDHLPYWPIVKPFQPISKSWRPYTMGSTGAVWIDSDGDGKISSAFDYANELTRRFEKDYASLINALSSYDEAVSVQAAALLYKKGIDLSSLPVTNALSKASSSTREGFKKFIEALPKTKRE